MKCTSVLTSSP